MGTGGERDKEIQGRKTERQGHGRGVYANTCQRRGKETGRDGLRWARRRETQFTEVEKGREEWRGKNTGKERARDREGNAY